MKAACSENLTADIADVSRELLAAATAFRAAAGQPGASQTFPSALVAIEESLRVLGLSIHELTHDAVPAVVERQRHIPGPVRGQQNGGRLSHEREAHIAATMHDVAQDFVRCAGSCGRAIETVAVLSLAPEGVPGHDWQGPTAPDR